MRYTRRNFISLTSKSFILPLMGPIPFISKTNNPLEHLKKTYREVKLTEEALRIHGEALVIDAHNDMPGNILAKGLNKEPAFTLNELQPQLQTDIPRLRKGGVDAQVFVSYI